MMDTQQELSEDALADVNYFKLKLLSAIVNDDLQTAEKYLKRLKLIEDADHHYRLSKNNDTDDEPYCNECGSDKLAFGSSYANGDEWTCKTCGHTFICI